jgi:hypothetical protein
MTSGRIWAAAAIAPAGAFAALFVLYHAVNYQSDHRKQYRQNQNCTQNTAHNITPF